MAGGFETFAFFGSELAGFLLKSGTFFSAAQSTVNRTNLTPRTK